MRRGQIVMEFLIIAGIALLMGTVYLAAGSHLLDTKTQEQRIAALNEIGYTVQDELILAATVQDGYQRRFTIPAKAGRFTYIISNDADTLTLQSDNLILNYPLPHMSGSLQQGTNIIQKDGSIRVNS